MDDINNFLKELDVSTSYQSRQIQSVQQAVNRRWTASRHRNAKKVLYITNQKTGLETTHFRTSSIAHNVEVYNKTQPKSRQETNDNSAFVVLPVHLISEQSQNTTWLFRTRPPCDQNSYRLGKKPKDIERTKLFEENSRSRQKNAMIYPKDEEKDIQTTPRVMQDLENLVKLRSEDILTIEELLKKYEFSAKTHIPEIESLILKISGQEQLRVVIEKKKLLALEGCQAEEKRKYFLVYFLIF